MNLEAGSNSMKAKYFLLLFCGAANAAPFVVSDPSNEAPTHCGVWMDSAPRQEIPVAIDATGAPYCRIDLESVSAGGHVIKASFVKKDAVWGTLESAQSAPFEFVRPGAPAAPLLLLVP